MILTDGIHLVSTENEGELHFFARRMGLKRIWVQCHSNHPKRKRPHYDLTTENAVRRAIRLGARMVSGRELIEKAWWGNDKKVSRG